VLVDGVGISSPDKVLFPDDGITKRELCEYYATVAPRMIPLVTGRPVMLQRFPNGIGRHGFMQKEAPAYAPPWVHRVEVRKEGGTVTHVLIDDAATLVWVANQNCVTPHVWLSRADRVERPDRLVFDVDPSVPDIGAVQRTALAVRDLLDELGLPSWVMATGSRGVHVVTVLDRSATFEEVHAFAHAAAELLVVRHPDLVTLEWKRSGRGSLVYLDILRNRYAQTTVAPYAVRPLPGAPIAVPLQWDEVASDRFDPRAHTLRTVTARLAGDDPWADLPSRGRSLRAPRRRLDALMRRERTG
jgi:bifunctional non-homologous end joining protein LigD